MEGKSSGLMNNVSRETIGGRNIEMINNKIVGAKVEIINILNGLEVPIAVSQLIINEVKDIIDKQTDMILAKEIEQEES